MRTILHFTLALLLSFPLISNAQVTGSIRFSGSIIDELSSDPVEKAKIFVYRDDEEEPFVLIYADEDGYFEFRLDEGYRYTLKAKATDYVPTKIVVESSDIPSLYASSALQASMDISLIHKSKDIPIEAVERLMEEPFMVFNFDKRKGLLQADNKLLNQKFEELNKVLASSGASGR